MIDERSSTSVGFYRMRFGVAPEIRARADTQI
jgi:hypothetical protein